MEIDYSLFKDSKENEIEKGILYNYKAKIAIYIILILMFLFIIYIFLIKDSIKNSNTIEEEKEIIFLVKKGNNTEVSRWKFFDKFNTIFELYRLYDFYDEYIGTPLNITNQIKEFFSINLSKDIFDIENYIKIKNYLRIDGKIETFIENGVLVLGLFVGTDILNIKFDKNFLYNLLKSRKKFTLQIGQFLLLSLIFYFYNNVDY